MKRLTNYVVLGKMNNEFPKDYTFSTDGLIYKKLGELEDIEEELGIDLVILFKALKNGFWAKSSTKITFCKEDKKHTVFIRHLGYDVEICCEESENTIDSKCKLYLERSTKDYGKTWALTKEELEYD